MISIVSNGQIQNDTQKNSQLPASLQQNKSIEQKPTKVQIRKKFVFIFLIALLTMICSSVVISGVVYGVLVFNRNLKNDVSRNQTKDARSWFNPDNSKLP
jgi:hypothetical protein